MGFSFSLNHFNLVNLKTLYRADPTCIDFDVADTTIAVVKGNYKQYYVYGVSAGTTTVQLSIKYQDEWYDSNIVTITVEGTNFKDGGFEAVRSWHDMDNYWKVDLSGDADIDSWGFDVESTFNMTGGNNMFIRMPNGNNKSTDGSVRIYQDLDLTADSYTFAVYIRRFPGIEQTPVVTIDGVDYDSFNTPVEIGVILLDAQGHETDTKYSKVYKDDYKQGVGDFEAVSVQFTLSEAGKYRMFFYAETAEHVGMGMQVDNFVLSRGQTIDHITASFGTDNTVNVDEALKIVWHAYYADGTEATVEDVRPTYLSSNIEVLSVTSDNKAMGMAPGEANIFVSITINGVDYNYTIEGTVIGEEEPDTPPTTVDPGEETPDKKGCKSFLGAGTLAISFALVGFAAVCYKRRKDFE